MVVEVEITFDPRETILGYPSFSEKHFFAKVFNLAQKFSSAKCSVVVREKHVNLLDRLD